MDNGEDKSALNLDEYDILEDGVLIEKISDYVGKIVKMGPTVLGLQLGELVYLNKLPDALELEPGNYVVLTETKIDRVGPLLIAQHNILTEVE